MPIVISYTDVKGLGTLAHQAGYDQAFAQGVRQNRVEDFRERSLEQRDDIHRDQLNARAQAVQFNEEGRNRRHMESLNAAEHARQLRLQEQIFNMQGRAGLEEQRQEHRLEVEHQTQDNRLERIDVEARHGKYKRSSKAEPTLDPGGLPSLAYAQEEVNKWHHMIPQRRPVGTAGISAERYGDTVSEATQISKLPTDEIQRILDMRPDDKLAPYMTAILADRRSVQGAAYPSNAEPDMGGGTGLGSGGGLAPDPFYGGLSDEELFNVFQRMPAGF